MEEELKGTLEGLKKSQEGNVLALKAFADTLEKMGDVLAKMDARLSKQEEDEKEDEMIEELATKVKSKMVAGQLSKEDSKEGPAKLVTTPGKQGADTIIQGSATPTLAKADEEEEEEKVDEDEPMEEDPQVKSMRSAFDKAVTTALKGVDLKGMIEKTVDDRLSKMGVSSATPTKRVSIPANPDSQLLGLKKSQNRDELVDQLTKLSWRQLSDLEQKVQSGTVKLD